MGSGEFNAGDNPAMDQHPIQGVVAIFLVASCYRNRLRPDEPLGSYADLTYLRKGNLAFIITSFPLILYDVDRDR